MENNELFLRGIVIGKPEYKTTDTHLPITNFVLRVEREGSNKKKQLHDFFLCSAFGSEADAFKAEVKSGDSIELVGHVEINRFPRLDQNKRPTGEFRFMTGVNVENWNPAELEYDDATQEDLWEVANENATG